MSSQREKRVAVGILLGTLALCALFLAQGTTRLVAASLFADDLAQPAVGGPGTARPAGGAGGVHDHENPDPILRKNIFDSESGDLTRQPEMAAADEQGAEANEAGFRIPDSDEQVQPCSGGARLVGTIVAPRYPQWSFAAVNDGGKPTLYRTGMDVGGLTLVGIRADRVYMAPKSGALCKLQMFAPGNAPPPPSPAVAHAEDANEGRKRAVRRAHSEGAISDQELEQGIQKVSDTEFNVQQSLVTKILENQAELMRSARIIPHEQGGRVVGVKLYGIRRDSALGALGIQNGDMLRNINGFDMTSPDSALEAYTKLRNADHLTVAVERRGKPMTIDYNIQ